MLAFAFNKEGPVTFTNNLVRRDIRRAKAKQKISNCFRTFKEAEIYARIKEFVSTTRRITVPSLQNYTLHLKGTILLQLNNYK